MIFCNFWRKFFDDNSRAFRKVSNTIRAYLQAIERIGDPRTVDMFGENPTPAKDVLWNLALKNQESMAEETALASSSRTESEESTAMELAGQAFETLTPEQQQLVQDVARQQAERIKSIYQNTPLWMKAPNGQPTNLTEQQWLQVRTPLFKRWFGDWEGMPLKEFLQGTSVSVLTGNEFQKEKGKSIFDVVAQWMQEKHQGLANNPILGEVVMDRKSIRDSWSHGAGRFKAAAFASVPDVISKGQIIDFQRNWKGRSYNTVVLAAPVKIGKDDRVVVVVVEQRKDNRFYLHEAYLKESLQNDGTSFKAGTFQKPGATAGDLFTILQGIFSVNPATVSKVVDANGEPMVVYHGTDSEFDVFRPRNNAQYNGIYFSSERQEAERYATIITRWNKKPNRIIPAFLKAANVGTTENVGGIKEALSKGHDSFNEQDVWVVANPNQIKSATDNDGSFTQSDTILHSSSRVPPATPKQMRDYFNLATRKSRLAKGQQQLKRKLEPRVEQALFGEQDAAFAEQITPAEAVLSTPQRAPEFYPGKLGIEKQQGLTQQERALEEKVAKEFEENTEAKIAEYIEKFGNVINTDDVRELVPEYVADRSTWARAVHEPASALAKILYERALQTPANPVVFMAGGGGSGKGVVQSKVSDKNDIIYDGTLANSNGSVKKIEQALKVGKTVRINYVHRPFLQAVKGILHRAESKGRTLNIGIAARDHIQAQKSLLNLTEHYKDNPNVTITIWDNSGTKDDLKKISLEEFQNKLYSSSEEINDAAIKWLRNETRRRDSENNPIPNKILTGLGVPRDARISQATGRTDNAGIPGIRQGEGQGDSRGPPRQDTLPQQLTELDSSSRSEIYPHKVDGTFRSNWKVTGTGRRVKLADGRIGRVSAFRSGKDFDVITGKGRLTGLSQNDVSVELTPEELEIEPHFIRRQQEFAALKPDFDATLDAIADFLPEGYSLKATLKGAPRALEKAAEKLKIAKVKFEYGQIEKMPAPSSFIEDLADILRATILVGSVNEVSQANAAILRAFSFDSKNFESTQEGEYTHRSNDGHTIIKIENRFLKPTPAGYADVQIKIELTPGHFAEIQVNIPEMLVAKEGNGVKEMTDYPSEYYPENLNIENFDPNFPGHKMFEEYRSIPDKTSPRAKELEAQMTALYKAAIAAHEVRIKDNASSLDTSRTQGSSPVRGETPSTTDAPLGARTMNLPRSEATGSPSSSTKNRAEGENSRGSNFDSITNYYNTLQANRNTELNSQSRTEELTLFDLLPEADVPKAKKKTVLKKQTKKAQPEADLFELTGTPPHEETNRTRNIQLPQQPDLAADSQPQQDTSNAGETSDPQLRRTQLPEGRGAGLTGSTGSRGLRDTTTGRSRDQSETTASPQSGDVGESSETNTGETSDGIQRRAGIPDGDRRDAGGQLGRGALRPGTEGKTGGGRRRLERPKRERPPDLS